MFDKIESTCVVQFNAKIVCPYCNRDILAENAYTDLPTNVLNIIENTKSVFFNIKDRKGVYWWISMCPSCNKPLLIGEGGKTVFPKALPKPVDNRIPENIRKDLYEAKLCFSVDAYRASVVMVRRALEGTCLNQGAPANENLYKQIEYLAEEQIITPNQKKIATAVRWVANDAAHVDPKQLEVEKEDAEEILEIAEHLLYTIYVSKHIAEKHKQKRKPNQT